MSDIPVSSTRLFFRRAILLFLLLATLVVAVSLFQAFQPQDLSDVGGYSTENASAPRDLKAVLKNAVAREYPVTITETELNQWMAKEVSMKQNGFLAGKVSLEHVWTRLQDGYAEIIMERKVFGKPFTTSMFMRIEQTESAKGGTVTQIRFDNGSFSNASKLMRGGHFGKLPVPQGFLLLVMPAYKKLGELFKPEVDMLFEKEARVKIEKGKFIFQANPPLSEESADLPF